MYALELMLFAILNKKLSDMFQHTALLPCQFDEFQSRDEKRRSNNQRSDGIHSKGDI
jgi:hypothetical protein